MAEQNEMIEEQLDAGFDYQFHDDESLKLNENNQEFNVSEGDDELNNLITNINTQNETKSEQNNEKSLKNQIKKQTSLQQTLIQIETKLSQKNSIQNKISVLKTINEMITSSRGHTNQMEILCNWIEMMKLLDSMLHEDSHPQILRNMQMILKFLYDNSKIDREWIKNYVQMGLKASHDQFIKTLQSFLNFLRIDDLLAIFQFISHEANLQNPNLAPILSAIVSSKALSESSSYFDSKISNSIEKVLCDEMQNDENIIGTNFLDELEEKKDQEEPMNEVAKMLTINLFKYLIEVADIHMNGYYPILNKLISSKHSSLSNQLFITLVNLLKNAKVNAVWVLEHCLKIDFGQTNKQKGSKNQNKCNFILKLVNEHLYEYLLIILCRCRFNKVVVDKILNIFILLSKNYKLLDDVYTQYIWKILGLNSRDEKEREQFFNFVRDILRNQSNFTEELVNFIFFEVLMSLKSEWFSLKILECLQMLFLRYNEDLKLISYVDQSYEIHDYDLVGIDKLWYIYFYSTDAKVIKKCKDFIWKLSTYNSKPEIKNKLLREYVEKIIFYMTNKEAEKRVDLCGKGFDMIDKMMEETQRKQGVVQYVQFNINNSCSQANAPKIISLRLSEKCSLSSLRQQISQTINPPNTKIKLLLKGNYLKGQKMTLKDLSIENGNTIMVVNDEPITKPMEQNKKILEETINKLQEIFDGEMQKNFLKFIAQKMQGEEIEKIINAMMNTDKLNTMKNQYEEGLTKDKEKEDSLLKMIEEPLENQNCKQMINCNKEMIDCEEKMQGFNVQCKNNEALKFSSLLISQPEYIKQLLFCASQCNKKRGWQTIKNLPSSSFALSQIRKNCENSEWKQLFPKQQFNEMFCIYYAHQLKDLLKADKRKMKSWLLEKGGFGYLVDWLRHSADKSNTILLEEVTNILVLILEDNCEFLQVFRKKINKKQQSQFLFPIIPSQCKQYLEELSAYGEQNFFDWLINLLLGAEDQSINPFPGANIAQLIIYFVLTNPQRIDRIMALPTKQIYRIIELHGFEGQEIFLSTISKCLNNNSSKINEYCYKLLGLADICFDFGSIAPVLPNVIYIYDLMACIMNQHSIITTNEQQFTIKCIQYISNVINKVELQALIGILNLLKLSIEKLHTNASSIDQKFAKKLIQFVNWLFCGYLFDLHNPSKDMRNRNVRKICYDIILMVIKIVGSVPSLIDSILTISIKSKYRQDDYIDFRTQDYIGLVNLGSTCYINSLLQQLYHTKFSKLVLEKGDIAEEQVCKLKQLKNIFMELCYSIKNVVNPKQFIKNMKFFGQPINTCVQQDATQFLLCLFDYIEEEGCRAEVEDVFGGEICNQITVDNPQSSQPFVKQKKQDFNSLTIDIKGKKNLQQALDYFIKPQTLDGQNKYYCQQLGKKMKACRRCYITKMPNILILTLKRFQFDFDSQSRHKLNDHFEFPLELDMYKYSEVFLKNNIQTLEQKYKLTGILVHSGSAQSGHYYSYIKIGQQWYQFNDKLVSQFNIQNLKNECFGCAEGKKTRNAYMLFYEKINTNYHGVYLNQFPETNYYKKEINHDNEIFLKTRLVYDDNFKKFLEVLWKSTNESKINQFINNNFVKKKNKQEMSSPKLINYDDESEQSLIRHNSQKKNNTNANFSNGDKILKINK